ncbi:MAG: methyl-accepting chemotaxis protein [Treponema sp.]|jgi:methyl-accepting chemotaxis protein|nr:methyl-accepting chemotaxis protein [Treponema sp.]
MKSLKKEFLLLFIGAGFLISAAVGLLMYYQYARYIESSYRQHLGQVTEMLVRAFPEISDLDYLVQEGKSASDAYWRLTGILQEIAKSFNLAYISVLDKTDSGYRFVLDSSTDKDECLEILAGGAEDFFLPYDTHTETMALAERSGLTQITPKPTVDEYGIFITSVTPLSKDGQLNGLMTVDFDISAIKEMERPALIALGIALALAFGISLAVSIVASASFIKPINNVMAALQAISKGDLTNEITTNRTDELGAMLHLLNRTQESVKTLIAAIADKAGSLSQVGAELSVMMSQSAAAVHEVNEQARSLKTKAGNQEESLAAANGAIEGIVDNINRLNRSIEEQAESVSRSSQAIEEMAANIRAVSESLTMNERNIENLTRSSEQGYNTLRRVSENIQDVARESERLLEINQVIENIASQTNLLSMNAAIEAAHAGEAGKGFAVVAGEIRKLAESSSKQAGTVAEVLKKIKSALDGISTIAGNALNHFKNIDGNVHIVAEQEEHIRKAMEEQNQGNNEILLTISKSQEISQDVRARSALMLAGSEKITRESKQLDAITSDLDHGMNEIASGVNQISTAVVRIQDISIGNKESIDALVSEIGKFRV